MRIKPRQTTFSFDKVVVDDSKELALLLLGMMILWLCFFLKKGSLYLLGKWTVLNLL